MLKLAILVGMTIGVGACNAVAPPHYLVAPADPGVPVRAPAYRDVTAGVKNFEVTGPRDWIEQNRDVAPQAPERKSGR